VHALGGCAQVGGVRLAAHAEVREVVQEVAEHVLAVLRVFLRVEDVAVPELVHVLGRRDGFLGELDQHGEEPLIGELHAVDVLARPTLTFFGIHQLELDRVEVERPDRCDDFIHGFVSHCGLLRLVGRAQPRVAARALTRDPRPPH